MFSASSTIVCAVADICALSARGCFTACSQTSRLPVELPAATACFLDREGERCQFEEFDNELQGLLCRVVLFSFKTFVTHW